MIVTKLTAGFGNQMFSYACGYALARRKGVGLLVDGLSYDSHYERPLEIDKLNISGKLITSNKPKWIRMGYRLILMSGNRYVKERRLYRYDDVFETLGAHVYLHGYWQVERYFREYREQLIQEFSPKKKEPVVEEYAERYRTFETCAVHIRRGDYLKHGHCINMDYYADAMRYVNGKKPGVRFIFFSDDLEWVKERFFGAENTEFFEKGNRKISDLDEFFIMSSCRNQIIANSTFSWWAAYLNTYRNRIVTAPRVGEWDEDFYPEEFVKIRTEKSGEIFC